MFISTRKLGAMAACVLAGIIVSTDSAAQVSAVQRRLPAQGGCTVASSMARATSFVLRASKNPGGASATMASDLKAQRNTFTFVGRVLTPPTIITADFYGPEFQCHVDFKGVIVTVHVPFSAYNDPSLAAPLQVLQQCAGSFGSQSVTAFKIRVEDGSTLGSLIKMAEVPSTNSLNVLAILPAAGLAEVGCF
jgi:hypothetical protein